ncbi:MAG: hypothetical protein QOJ91_2839 [Sphingomonadales bacterium]|nr:hypothetical protein [Sphingomonadales bacterium]
MTGTAAYAGEACRLFVMVALAAAVAGKTMAIDDFRDTLLDLPLVSIRNSGAAALAVIGIEALVLGAVGVAPRVGMAAALVTFLLMSTAILIALVTRRALTCNCFGGRARPVSWLDLVRNLTLIGACAFFLSCPPLDRPGLSEWLLLLGIAFIAFVISTNLDEIAAPAD